MAEVFKPLTLKVAERVGEFFSENIWVNGIYIFGSLVRLGDAGYISMLLEVEEEMAEAFSSEVKKFHQEFGTRWSKTYRSLLASRIIEFSPLELARYLGASRKLRHSSDSRDISLFLVMNEWQKNLDAVNESCGLCGNERIYLPERLFLPQRREFVGES